MADPIVELRSVSKRFGEGPFVLREIELRVETGDFISFIGPSGCGKSTLLRLIAGLSPVTEGELHVSGAPAGRPPEDLGFVFQDATLLPWLSVARNVEVPMTLRRVPRRERALRRAEALAQVRLQGREDAYPRQLSGGQKMRVSLARALALRPRLLLLDEPFGALDEMTRDHLNEELLLLRAQQAWTAFFVTHSVAEAVFLSNRVVVLSANPGRVHEIVDVPFNYPRTAETRESEAYLRLVAHVSRVLRSVDAAPAART